MPVMVICLTRWRNGSGELVVRLGFGCWMSTWSSWLAGAASQFCAIGSRIAVAAGERQGLGIVA